MYKTILQQKLPGSQTLEICQGDLTAMKVDAIVNAANAHLAHGGGVAAAISRAGGPAIQQESSAWVRSRGPVSHASPAYTSGGNMPCKYVIHAVGPVWGSGREEEKLSAAILGSLALANELKLTSIAFPAISTGIFGFPKELAASIFMRTIPQYFEKQPHGSLRQVMLVLYDTPTLTIFCQAFKEEFHLD
jgi:O-acetyl-ADP-ribose deacetylase (regulator of RNase III)